MKSKILGVKWIKNFTHNDNRGKLFKVFNNNEEYSGFKNSVKEIWFTVSKKDVIRGMHMQVGKEPSSKMITLIKGKVEDVIIDLREDSPTYKLIESRIIQDSEFSLLLPPGVAHGYKVLIENSIVQYVSNAKHSKKDDLGIRYDSFGYNWNLNNPIISNRDREMPPLNEK